MISKQLAVEVMTLYCYTHAAIHTREETGIDFTESQIPPSVELSWIPGQ